MPEFKVIHDPEREESSRGRKAFTFTVDGVPSLMWFPNASSVDHPGRPADYFVQRTIRRLQEGRSTEAFGDSFSPQVLPEGDVAVRGAIGKVPRAGRGKVLELPPQEDTPTTDIRGKPRVARPRYTYELDGKTSEESYHTEAEAKAACAIAAFMTRGKLGKVAAAQAALKEQFPDGEEVEVYACAEKHKVCAVVDGEEYAVGFEPDGSFRFKKVEVPRPAADQEE